MHRFILPKWAQLLLALTLVIPVCYGANKNTKEPPVDLSILKQSEALASYMTPTQKIEFVRLETTLEQAQSDLRSGEYLANTKPSTFDPDRDLRPIIERGKAMIEKSQATIDTTQRAMVRMLESVEAQRAELQATDLTKYDYTLQSTTIEKALKEQARELMETVWALGYETLFFDGVFIHDSEGLRRAEAGLRNQAYDAFVEIDGSQFSLTIPVDFQLKPSTRGNSRQIFSYENAAIFENDKKALLILELIIPENSTSGLFSLRAVDTGSQIVAAQKLVKITGLSAVMEAVKEDATDALPEAVEFRDPTQKVELFAGLSQPYVFEMVGASPLDIDAVCLSQALIDASGLKLADSRFILEAYGTTLEAPENWIGQANAQLALEATTEDGTYQLSAQAKDSDRRVAVGTLRLTGMPVPTEAAAE